MVSHQLQMDAFHLVVECSSTTLPLNGLEQHSTYMFVLGNLDNQKPAFRHALVNSTKKVMESKQKF